MKRKILPILLLIMVTVCVCCNKTHQCKCVVTDTVDDGRLKIMDVDGSLACKDIKMWATEQRFLDDTVQTLVRSEQHSVSCRNYGR